MGTRLARAGSDQENRITGAAGYTYTYDADGNRVEKCNGTTGTIYWYMSPGIVAESDLTGSLKSEYVFFDGRRTARKDYPGGAVSYYFTDHLKTAHVITDSAGTIKEDEDFYPWGGELPFVNNDPNKYKFSDKERDAETGLDYFGARFYGNALGRFTSPDPKMISKQRMLDPQQWNMYVYARDNPVIFVDPNGKEVTIYLLNHAGYDENQAMAISQRTAQTLSNSGIKNVTIIVTQDMSVTKLENNHTLVGELVHGDQGKLGTTGGEQGKHAVLSHQFVVNVDKSNPVPGANGPRTAEEREATAVGNVTSHEITHEFNTNDNLGNLFLYGSHGDGLFKDAMDLGTLYDPHTTIPEPQRAGLQDQFNRDNELDNGITIDTTKATVPENDKKRPD